MFLRIMEGWVLARCLIRMRKVRRSPRPIPRMSPAQKIMRTASSASSRQAFSHIEIMSDSSRSRIAPITAKRSIRLSPVVVRAGAPFSVSFQLDLFSIASAKFIIHSPFNLKGKTHIKQSVFIIYNKCVLLLGSFLYSIYIISQQAKIFKF